MLFRILQDVNQFNCTIIKRTPEKHHSTINKMKNDNNRCYNLELPNMVVGQIFTNMAYRNKVFVN